MHVYSTLIAGLLAVGTGAFTSAQGKPKDVKDDWHFVLFRTPFHFNMSQTAFICSLVKFGKPKDVEDA